MTIADWLDYYMRQPKGFEEANRVRKVSKSIYGHRHNRMPGTIASTTADSMDLKKTTASTHDTVLSI